MDKLWELIWDDGPAMIARCLAYYIKHTALLGALLGVGLAVSLTVRFASYFHNIGAYWYTTPAIFCILLLTPYPIMTVIQKTLIKLQEIQLKEKLVKLDKDLSPPFVFDTVEFMIDLQSDALDPNLRYTLTSPRCPKCHRSIVPETNKNGHCNLGCINCDWMLTPKREISSIRHFIENATIDFQNGELRSKLITHGLVKSTGDKHDSMPA